MSPKKKASSETKLKAAAKRRAKIRKLALVVGIAKARKRRTAARRAA
jgi:hypothetical protein